MNHNIIKFPSAQKTSKNAWSVRFGAVKSVDVSETQFKSKAKPNPYIRGKRYQKLPGVNMRGMSSSEAY